MIGIVWRLNAQKTIDTYKHGTPVNRVILPTWYKLIILVVIYMNNGINQLSKWMADDGSQVYHYCRWQFTDEQGVKAK